MNLIEKYFKSMQYTKVIAKQYQSNIKAISTHEFVFKNESRNNMNEKEKLLYHTRKCQLVLHQYNEKNFLLRVQYTIASNALRQRTLQQQQQQQAKHLDPISGNNESETVSELWNSIWYHEFWNIVRYQELWNNNGLALDINR